MLAERGKLMVEKVMDQKGCIMLESSYGENDLGSLEDLLKIKMRVQL